MHCQFTVVRFRFGFRVAVHTGYVAGKQRLDMQIPPDQRIQGASAQYQYWYCVSTSERLVKLYKPEFRSQPDVAERLNRQNYCAAKRYGAKRHVLKRAFCCFRQVIPLHIVQIISEETVGGAVR